MMRLLRCTKWYGGSKSTPSDKYKIVRSGHVINFDHPDSRLTRSPSWESEARKYEPGTLTVKIDPLYYRSILNASHLGQGLEVSSKSGENLFCRTTGKKAFHPPKPSPHAGICWHQIECSTSHPHCTLRGSA